MASACVNNIGLSPEKFSSVGYSSYGWTSPRASLGREGESSFSEEQSPAADSLSNQDPVDFEFRLEDPVAMLSADELFSDGKLVPLKFPGTTPAKPPTTTTEATKSSEMVKSCRRLEMEISGVDQYLFSPKAPRCTTRWRELLGLKRLAKAQESSSSSSLKTTPLSLSSSSTNPKMTTLLSSSSPNPKTTSFKNFLHRNSKSSLVSSSSSSDSLSLNHPLLMKDSDICESLSISSSRLSLSSSSSSGHELDELPRLSLDLDKKPGPNPFAPARSIGRSPTQPRMRLAKPRPSTDGRSPARRRHQAAEEQPGEQRGLTVTADSPRLNASGKLVFHGLERSSSSPGSFNGGPRMKHHHGMPRSYSANVRITPVLNVPVCSLRGSSKSGLFGQLFSSSASSSSSPSSSVSSSVNRGQLHSNTKNRTNRP
ncbi:PREDICTED: uncharacterized protein DDB_G0271670 [Tarenaya hassleriana]|uniref:uncharacterized protein DDB_G0271670 n=1 Tax=Tarenaya hassleriana TaxID=28532 RepID=UPI00053C950F|nr:PREDICTED: uncharacterized protein DDB_G0271670 [Tarenaya hassleriana]